MTTAGEGMSERLARIETKLDALIDQRTDHEQRLRKLERWALIVAVGAGAGGGTVAQLVPAIGG
ncbi:hypothetical protein BJF85_16775 [Saccharomonospora sp. CUA-673]|uniref:hypothetical protein n=1 Tax=Saccharomonospora sp. CUA-673 TaxID=1904969 RepID=UPI0009609C9C|nr:hypothetical protein [Saccharomonospora sp. CUA-673]OLT46497.1 hypothetical protein BJF85_16775 [Saccharomonospora sp. CUA-673]